MGLIQDNRPRDWAYLAAFKEKDLPSLEKMAKHIRETHDINMIEDFNTKCEQKLTGKTAVLDNGIEIEAVTKTGDLVVNGGLDQCIRIIQGTSTARWTHFGMSQGNTPNPTVTDTALILEIIAARVVLAWNEAVGMRLYFGGISGQTDLSRPNVVGEIGVYNGSAVGATLLNRSLFLSNAATQQEPDFGDVTASPIIVSAVIEVCPVV
jgi:hypothetical protein